MAGVLDFIPLFPTQTEGAIYTRLAEWANEGLQPGDARWVDSREGSIFWIMMRPFARELATFYDRVGTEVPAAGHPLYAWGTYLDDAALVYGLTRLPSTPAGGEVIFYGAGGEQIISGTVVGVVLASEDTSQPTYEVTETGTIPAPVPPPVTFSASPLGTGGTFAAGTYFWKITALGGAGESLASTEASTAIVLTGRASLTWSAAVGATGYRIYRSTVTDGQATSPALVAEVGAVTAYTDTGAATTTGQTPTVDTTASVSLDATATETGVEGNASSGSVTEAITPLAASVTLTNPEPMVGGTDTETDESFRTRFLEVFQPVGAGTRSDYARWTLARPGVGRVTVLPVWNGPGTVKLIVMTADGQPVAPSVVEDLQGYFDPDPGLGAGQAPIGHIVTVETATTLAVTIEATLTLDAAYSLDGSGSTVAIQDVLEESLADYLGTLEPGGTIVISQIVGRLVEVSGVLDVTAVEINNSSTNVGISAAPRVPCRSSTNGPHPAHPDRCAPPPAGARTPASRAGPSA